MQLVDGAVLFSPHDLISTMQCHHRLALDTACAHDLLAKPQDDEMAALTKQFGLRHEEVVVKAERIKVQTFVALEMPDRSIKAYQQACEATREAMQASTELIARATFFVDGLLGFADLLRRVEYPDGYVCYEPVDVKSAKTEKAEAIVQTAVYGRAIERLGFPAPRQIHLLLANDHWSDRAAPYLAYASFLWQKTTDLLADLPTTSLPEPSWGERKSACEVCRWQEHCLQGRRTARDLSLLPEIRNVTVQKLKSDGVKTLPRLAACVEKPPDLAAKTFEKLRAQAVLQQQTFGSDEVRWQIWNAAELATMPTRDEGDVWFDIEGFPFYEQNRSLEYLFGYGYLNPNWVFETATANDLAEEKRAFEAFIDFLMHRWANYPLMHVYHYASYERTALSRLTQFHGTRENEVDDLLRNAVLFDLYSLVRRALITSTESLSLKAIEPLYGSTRSGDQIEGSHESIVKYNAYVLAHKSGDEARAQDIFAQIVDYNEKDVKSTLGLDTWLRSVIATESDHPRIQVPSPFNPRPADNDDDANNDDEADLVSRDLHDLAAALERRFGTDAEPYQEADCVNLLADVIQYYERERKAGWWRVFALMKTETEQLLETTGTLVADEVEVGPWTKEGRQRSSRRQVTIRTSDLDPRDFFDPEDDLFLLYDQALPGMNQFSDSTRGYSKTLSRSSEFSPNVMTVTERLPSTGVMTWTQNPVAVMTGAPISAMPIRRQLTSLGEVVLERHGANQPPFPEMAWADILLRRRPRGCHEPISRTAGHTFSDKVEKALKESNDSYVAVQGPPGTGKTRLGAEVVTRLVEVGWRIGVIAQSHEVIENFMTTAHQLEPELPMAKRARIGEGPSYPWHFDEVSRWASIQRGGYLIGGTAWQFAREEMRWLGLDLMVIDEAGQFTLASSLGALSIAERALLLGDPQQLAPVSQATHATAVDESVLGHVMQQAATMPSDLGFFLPESYRMHPVLAKAVSALQYEGKLSSFPFTAERLLDGVTPGLLPTPVTHDFASTRSLDEAQKATELVQDLIGRSWVDADANGPKPARALTASDLLVIAPFNDQVRLLRRQLKQVGLGDVSVGTVDKMQGRQAVVTVVSMTTSDGEHLPRGLEFLLSPNRLNVAISRSQWATYLLYSPRLLNVEPRSPEALKRLASFVELIV